MNKERKGSGFDWSRENYCVVFKFSKEKQHHSSMPVRSKKFSISARETEEHVFKELKKKTYITNVWFENREDKHDNKKKTGVRKVNRQTKEKSIIIAKNI